MAKNDETPEVVQTPGTDPTDVPPAAAPAPVAVEHEQSLRAVHPVEVGGQMLYVDPEIEERNEEIAALEQEIRDAERENRRKLVDDERRLTIANLDDRKAELQAQLARVRGETPEE